MKKSTDSVKITRYISEFLNVYAPNFLTTSECTKKSYRDALKQYISFLELEGVTTSMFSRENLERIWIEKWILWMKNERKCSPETCNVRLGSLRVFLKFLGEKEIEFKYLFQEAKDIRRQKCVRKKVSGLTRRAVEAMLSVPDPSAKTGKRDLVFLALLYATAARLDEIRSIKIENLHLDAEKPYVVLIGKREKIRTAYLLPKIVRYISVYVKDVHGDCPDPKAYLFYSRVGGKHEKLTEAALSKRIKICALAAHEKCSDVPIDAHAHQFRHAKASHWLEDGMNVVQVSFLLGHAQLETTMRYLDISKDEKLKAMATLESEKQSSVPKKWRSSGASLKKLCGFE